MTDGQKQTLVAYVRLAAEHILADSSSPPAPASLDAIPYGGLFVTFRNRGKLRGCMGRLSAPGPMTSVLPEVVDSVLHDPRFNSAPIRGEELACLHIEVSVLQPLQRVKDVSTLVAGKHGIVVACGDRRGCFLPQVATENGWNMQRMLTECCTHKAGLAPDAWRDPQARIDAFEVELAAEPKRTG